MLWQIAILPVGSGHWDGHSLSEGQHSLFPLWLVPRWADIHLLCPSSHLFPPLPTPFYCNNSQTRESLHQTYLDCVLIQCWDPSPEFLICRSGLGLEYLPLVTSSQVAWGPHFGNHSSSSTLKLIHLVPLSQITPLPFLGLKLSLLLTTVICSAFTEFQL